MHYVLLGLGIIVGIYGLYRFFLNANVKQIAALFTVGGFIAICAALFFLALTGRLPAALGLLAALWPIGISLWHKRVNKQANTSHTEAAIAPMSDKEALEVLGLDEGAQEKEIKDAYTKLMKKVHPDQEGSKWMAAKLNQAKETLLR